MENIKASQLQGKVRAYLVKPGQHDPKLWLPTTPLSPNLVLYGWSDIVGKLLSTGDSRYRIGGMYLEYKNVDSLGETVSPPSFGRDRSIEYYNSLSSSASVDYLRVPATAITVSKDQSNPDQTILTCFARSSGLAGVHGKPFTTQAKSVVYGAALVAYVDATDATQDLLFSCFYFDPENQQPRLQNSQIGLEWQITLE
jgi:hypothetical protein